jgi:integral membrane protein (TIGR01906 family)
MNITKYIYLVLRWLFILCLPWLIVTAALRIPASCPYLYEYLFQKYNVGETTGLDDAALKVTAQGLVHYFNSGEENINLVVQKDGIPFSLFNEREIVHLKDVKGLFLLDLWVFLGTLAYCLGYAVWAIARGPVGRKLLARSMLIGGGITFGLIVLIGIGMLFDFDALLLRFHLLSFSNDFWLLDPAHDYLIMLVTGGFMYDASFIVAGTAIAGAVIVGACGGTYLWYQLRCQKAS